MLCALASYLDAKAHSGRWLVRIEDLDPPREQPGASQLILDSLRHHGLHWDGELCYQSQRLDLYASALQQLQAAQQTFHCICRRADLAAQPGPYPGVCRDASLTDSSPTAIRLRVNEHAVTFLDAIQGEQSDVLAQSCGDFIIRRKDGLFAYQLAVAVDDADQSISHVVRGFDLLDSTTRQIHVLNCLNQAVPAYTHIPVLVDAEGTKLSKQTAAPPIDDRHATSNLRKALSQLGQPVPTGTSGQSVESILHFAVEHYAIAGIPTVTAIPAD